MPALKPVEKLYYSIKEVAERLNVETHTLRFWEKEFKELRPKKNANNVRFYTKEDIETVELIHYLLKKKRLTIEGARKRLKDNKGQAEQEVEVKQRLAELKERLNAMIRELE